MNSTPLMRDPAAPLTRDVAPAMRRAPKYRSDWLMLATALTLSLIGAILVWSATRTPMRLAGRNENAYLYRHLFNVMIAVGLAFVVSRLDTRLLRFLGPIAYIGAIVGLLAVFAVGATINGAHAWIRLGGGFEIQPSEFMKIGLIVAFAVLFSRGAVLGREQPRNRDIVVALVLGALPLGLIMLQPDLGSAMVLTVTSFGVFVAARVPARWTVGLLLLGVLGAVIVVKAGMLADYQLARFGSFTHPHLDPQGTSYNVTQAHIAIAHGGLFGAGLFHGPQTRGGFVPEQQTDFVYSVAGEEFGFVGAVFIIGLFALLCWRALRIAACADAAGRLVAAGVVCWFAFQAFQNIGMNLGLTPVTGLPLPFVSYGGSSMFAQGIAIGLLVAIDRQARKA